MARVPKKHEGVKGLLDNLSEALVILDPAFEVVEWNPAMERLTGVRSADAIGRSAAAMLPLFRDTTLVPLIRRALAGESPDAIELPHTTAGDDRVLWLRARCVPWRDDEGEVTAGNYVWRPKGNRHIARSPNGALVLSMFLRPNKFLAGGAAGQDLR